MEKNIIEVARPNMREKFGFSLLKSVSNRPTNKFARNKGWVWFDSH